MDKVTSVFGALDAGKLPSAEQLNQFIDWLDQTAIPAVEMGHTNNLTAQGGLLVKRIRQVLRAYKQLSMNKNGDNILQEAFWHLTRGEITTAGLDTEQASEDIATLRSAVRSLISIVSSSISSESSSLINEFASFTRLSLADAAELIETSAGNAKETLRKIEQDVQRGERTSITGRDKQRVEAERKDVKVQWEHGMDAVKSAGETVIDTSRSVSATMQDKSDKTTSRVYDAYFKICERAQSDPAYRDAVESLISVIQKRTHQTLDSSNVDSLASFFDDPTPEKHIHQALANFQIFFERLSSTPLSRLIAKTRGCLDVVSRDPVLRNWFDDLFALARQHLMEPGYARSEGAKEKRRELQEKWESLVHREDGKWQKAVEGVKIELARIQDGISKDKDLERVRVAHIQLGQDLEKGLLEVGGKTKTGLEALLERATWLWQDVFKVYIPHFLGFLSHLPIPRTEYKDSEIEFVLENLDVSSLNILPSHVYVRHITDVDIITASSPTGGARTAVGTLTRVKIDAVQLKLNDVSFWYKDLNASALAPAEFSGLLGLALPPQGITLDIKVRLIPSSIPSSHPGSRASLGHFHVIEHVEVSISEDVKLQVKDSNHGILLAMFKPVFMLRLRQALERTLAGQVRALLDWTDSIAWDVGKRKEVLEDTGTVSGNTALLAAVWSELGRFRRERRERGAEVMFRATGTGVIVEQRDVARQGNVSFAMGAEPQILSGLKRGPLGTASEPLGRRVRDSVQDVTGVDVGDVLTAGDVEGELRESAGQIRERARGLLDEGQKHVESFQSRVAQKKAHEEKRSGWRSDAFNM